MLKKINTKKFVIAIVCIIISMTTIVSFASSGVRKNISAYYNNIKLVVDGKEIALGKDTAGNDIEPFAFNGTTYLPVRAIGEALGKEVQWDGESQTVYVGKDSNESEYITEKLIGVMDMGKTYNLKDKNKLIMGGKTYKTGYKLSKTWAGFLYFNLDGQYREVQGEIGSVDTAPKPHDVEIFLDDKLYKTIKISGDKIPEKVTIPVSGVNQLKFNVVELSYGYNPQIDAGFGDFTIK